jgi:hypothetical protein
MQVSMSTLISLMAYQTLGFTDAGIFAKQSKREFFCGVE